MIRRCVVCSCTDAHACPAGCAWRPGFAAIGLPVCTACVLTFSLPLPLNLGNRRGGHWGPTWKARGTWIQRAVILEPLLRGRRPVQPLAWARVQTTLVLDRAMDADNAAARLKWALDLLVQRGWLVDDGARHCDIVLPVRQLIDRAKPKQMLIGLDDLPAPATLAGAAPIGGTA